MKSLRTDKLMIKPGYKGICTLNTKETLDIIEIPFLPTIEARASVIMLGKVACRVIELYSIMPPDRF